MFNNRNTGNPCLFNGADRRLSGMADDKRYMGYWIGHLHQGERNRIHSGGLNPQESAMLAKGEDPWAKFRGPLPPSVPAYVPPQGGFDGQFKDIPPEELKDLELETKSDVDKAAESIEQRPVQSPEEQAAIISEQRARDRARQSNEQERGKQQRKETRYIRQHASLTRAQQERLELLRFMPKQVRDEYEKADAHQRKIIWEGNKQAFKAARKREKEKLARDQKFMEQVFDLLQQIKEQAAEDPSKANLLPPDGASLSDLREWYQEMQKPMRPVPFPGPGWVQLGDPERERQRRDAELLERRERLLAREEALRRRGRFPAEREDLVSKLLDQSELRKRENLVEREEALARERAKATTEPSSPPKPPTAPPPGDELLRGLETKEIVALVVTFLALVLVFFVGAPTAAGVIDMTLARILLFAGWAGAVIAAFVIEVLSTRSRKRIAMTTILTAFLVGAFALFSNYWIGKKKAEQEALTLPPQQSATPSPSATPKTFSQSSPLLTIAATPSPTPSPSASPGANDTTEHREFVQLSAETLLDVFTGRDKEHATRLVEPYIGKWIRVSSVIHDIKREDVSRMTQHGSKTTPTTILTLGLKRGERFWIVNAGFTDQRWIDRVIALKSGEKITVIGKIDFISRYGIGLTQCEVVE